MPKTLLRSIWFLAAVGGAALALSGECQPLFLFVFAGLFFIGLWIGRFPRLAQFLGSAQPFLAALVFVVALVDFFSLSNSFLLTVAHFLLSLQGLRLLALRTTRECLGSLLIASLTVLSASTLSVDWSFFVLLFVFLGGLVWTLTMLTVLDESRRGGQAAQLHENSLLWRQLMPVLRGASSAAFLIAIGCCAVVFVVFPRFNLQGFRGQFLQPVHKTGFTSQVDLGSSSRIFTDDSVVMRVQLDPRDKDQWTGYMRGRTLGWFDGKVWKPSPRRLERVYRTGRGRMAMPLRDAVPQKLLHQQIYLESMDSPLLFAQSKPIVFELDRPFIEVGEDDAAQRGNGDSWRVHYDVESGLSLLDPLTSHLVSPKKWQRARLRPPKPQERTARDFQDDILYIPAAEKPVLEKLAGQWTVSATDSLSKALRIEDSLRKNYRYSLEGQRSTETQPPLEQFLLESKQGHCEYFASAMCLMLRSQGIPTRMATGFLSHEWNDRGGYFIVRAKHAHAWVEAYIEPYGWIGFDPSPRDPGVSQGSQLTRRWMEFMDDMNLKWNRYILSYDVERQIEIVKAVTQQSSMVSLRFGKLTSWSQKISGSLKFNAKTPSVGWALLLLMCGGLVIGGMSLRHGKRDRVWFYRALLKRLERRLGKKPMGMTLEEFILKGSQKIQAADVVGELQKEYYRLRFGDVSAKLSPAAIRHALKKI